MEKTEGTGADEKCVRYTMFFYKQETAYEFMPRLVAA